MSALAIGLFFWFVFFCCSWDVLGCWFVGCGCCFFFFFCGGGVLSVLGVMVVLLNLSQPSVSEKCSQFIQACYLLPSSILMLLIPVDYYIRSVSLLLVLQLLDSLCRSCGNSFKELKHSCCFFRILVSEIRFQRL